MGQGQASPAGALTESQSQGILSTAATKTPGFVYGFGGAILVVSVCVIAVLKLGGLDGPIQRIGNAYASQIEESTKKTDRSADRIEDATRHLMGVIERVGRIDATVQSYIRAMQDAVDRLARIEVSISDQSRRLSDVERRLTGVERRSYIPRRVPTQVDPK